MNRFLGLCGLVFALVLTGCAKPVPYDYTAFKQSKPKSILVLPPVNHSPDVKASYSLLSQVTYPLAESGYYVLPVAVVDETFKQNGLSTAADIHALSTAKLHQIFGADAALYLDVKEYGTSYIVISSETRVSADARLVDLRTGKLLWSGSATASSNEQQSNSNGGIIGALVQAAVSQIADTISDKGHDIAGVTSARLLAAGHPRGMLYGPRSLQYGKETY
ncbi:hypothetical protein BSK71_18365 [Pectobacterium actinidiae]|uniref:DUF799 domain-containing protein n=1 Tax=Pectobacterium actinidiae TaxID=1507808 RepID=A0A1V2QZV4_9GAMM|nr:DUF799 domain-containing protein [Pectobacterium actinidiae]QDX99206.1 hypothetical protein EGD00_22430 [Pectobacterium carotovorum subsp. carotovorum]KHN89696.1 hypothetical protein KKH3_41970 [Pectobacterium actinidiae]ONK01792.1 hypothetical protein BSK69_18695 [Pectobacterium actinidiae]ONK02419.1 hypothetical protein BSK71_18365 [Pectobacterium actinidiae]WEF12122.1 DUF799 domain-containing protein [Pectobacterium actinidiae]